MRNLQKFNPFRSQGLVTSPIYSFGSIGNSETFQQRWKKIN